MIGQRISLLNFLLLLTSVSLCVGWVIDRRSYVVEQERNNEAEYYWTKAVVLTSFERTRKALSNGSGVSFQAYLDHELLFLIRKLFEHEDEISKLDIEDLTSLDLAHEAAALMKCKTAQDLKVAFQKQFEFLSDEDSTYFDETSDEHRKFQEFLDRVFKNQKTEQLAN